MTSAWAQIARARAGRRHPWVVLSSSPRQRSVGGLSSKSTMDPNLYKARGSPQGLIDEFPAIPTTYTHAMVSIEDVTDALREVIDPELGLDFVELGLIYEVTVDDGSVTVTYTLTSPGCPIGPQVSEQIEEFVGELEGVQDVQPIMTFSPPWTPERMSEDAKFALGF